jgi:hypothetical protein
MILLVFAGTSLLQLALYFLSYRMRWKFPDFLILIIFLVLYYAFLPQFFYPEPRRDGVNCGMPILAITMVFWIIGTIAGVLIHFLWKLILLFIKKHNTVQ